MHLKHLEIQGYKSFANKTEFLFPGGITAIIGPNGSGKSNFADAVRWALGERSMRSLRAKSTADMIFAGGHGRARAGMAQVALTLDNADGSLPIEYSEITIARRAYRSGENEYLINGSQVLLRDITELLAESGLSERTYTVIGQGLVDAALSLRPQERRDLFEEAAGISLYRERREKTVERLDETRHNLERVHDIVSEITPRLKQLKQDAQQVEEHRRLTAHLERLQRTWFGYQWGQLQATLERALEKASNLKTRLEAQRREASKLSERLGRLREREGDLRAKLRDWYRESAELHEQTDKAQRKLAVSEERERLLKARREELLEEIEPLKARREEQAAQLAEINAQVEQLGQELEKRKKRLADVKREWESVQENAQQHARRQAQAEQDLRTYRERLKQLNQALMKAREEVSNLASEQAVAEERARQLKSRRQEILTELKPLDSQEKEQSAQFELDRARLGDMEQEMAERKQRLAELKREWKAAQAQSKTPPPELQSGEQELREHRAQIKRLAQEIQEAQSEEARLAGELKALERMHLSGAAYDQGVQALLQADLDGVLGPFASLIQVEPAWERAVEAALGDDLQSIVVERTAMVEAIQRVLASSGGRLTLLPLDGLRSRHTLPPETLCAARVVTCEANIGGAVEAMLGGVALCDDLAEARDLLTHMPPGSRCVTRAGVVLRADGALMIGQTGSGGLLTDERTRRELPRQLEQIQRDRQKLEEQRQREAAQITRLEARLESITREANKSRQETERAFQEKLSRARTASAVIEEKLRNQQEALRREEKRLKRIRSQQAALQRQAEDLEAKHTAAVERAQALHAAVAQLDTDAAKIDTPTDDLSSSFRAKLEAAHRRRRDLEAQQRELSEQIGALEAQSEHLSRQTAQAREEAARFERERLAPARTEVAVAEESLRSQQATLKRERGLLAQLRSQVEARHQRADELEQERNALTGRIDELHQETQQLGDKLRKIRQHIQPTEEELDRLAEEQTSVEKRLQKARDRVREAEGRHGRAQLDVERSQDELHILARRIDEELGLVEIELAESVTAQTPLPLRPLVSELPVVEKLPEGLKDEMKFLKTRIRRLGAINPNAPEELADVEERHHFLTEQAADLEAATARLRQGVSELDELMEKAFRETFDAVAEKFAEMFTTLFGGGKARLELTEPDDLLNTGVDITAQPPGKRARQLALLSGGERALTAVALLFSLLHASPTPFCILDEVDAMLDEANVGRFRAQLEKLAQQTQFIVITHNRSTVESADTVYGVSMGSDAVSQVVSLKLEEDGELRMGN